MKALIAIVASVFALSVAAQPAPANKEEAKPAAAKKEEAKPAAAKKEEVKKDSKK